MLVYMRLSWLVVLIGCAGCWGDNPAFMATAGADGSSGDSGGEASGSTGRPPLESTGEAPSTTTATPGTTATSTTGDPEPVTTGPGTTTAAGSTGAGETLPATSEPNDTTNPGESSTGAESICGNGVKEPGEECDEPDATLEEGKCAPTCHFIQGKLIFAINPLDDDPIPGGFAEGADLTVADEKCTTIANEKGYEGQFKALIGDEKTRWGAVQPYDGDCSPDWPLHPYTAYLNTEDLPIWITDEIRLLGVRATMPGQPQALGAKIAGEQFTVWTGIKSTWQPGSHCAGWKGGVNTLGTVGKPYKQEVWLDAGGNAPCAGAMGIVCVQQ